MPVLNPPARKIRFGAPPVDHRARNAKIIVMIANGRPRKFVATQFGLTPERISQIWKAAKACASR